MYTQHTHSIEHTVQTQHTHSAHTAYTQRTHSIPQYINDTHMIAWNDWTLSCTPYPLQVTYPWWMLIENLIFHLPFCCWMTNIFLYVSFTVSLGHIRKISWLSDFLNNTQCSLFEISGTTACRQAGQQLNSQIVNKREKGGKFKCLTERMIRSCTNNGVSTCIIQRHNRYRT